MNRKIIAVYDRANPDANGVCKIKQVVKCFEQDAASQHQAFPGHHYADVTDHPEEVKARSHAIDLKTGKPVQWFDRDLAKREKLVELHNAHHSETLKDPNEAELVSAALLGGETEKQALHAHVATRKARQAKLATLLTTLESAQTPDEIKAISWAK